MCEGPGKLNLRSEIIIAESAISANTKFTSMQTPEGRYK